MAKRENHDSEARQARQGSNAMTELSARPMGHHQALARAPISLLAAVSLLSVQSGSVTQETHKTEADIPNSYVSLKA